MNDPLKKPLRPLKPFNVVCELQIALQSGGKKKTKAALQRAQQFLDENDNPLGRAAPFRPLAAPESPEEALAWDLANVDHHTCGNGEKAQRRANLIQGYISENYREVQDPAPWHQQLFMEWLKGVSAALGVVLVFAFFSYLLTGQI